MAKRGPQFELTDRNWDQEEEPEEAGVFKQAADDVIQSRMIKKAKRRLPDQEGNEPKNSPFGGFGGLITSRPSLKPSDAKKSPIKFGGNAVESNATPFKTVGIFSGASASTDPEDALKSHGKDSSYLQALKSLNESVLAWIKQHVEKNPYIILSPIFKDYEKHLIAVEGKKSPLKNVSPDSIVSNSKTADAESKPASNSLNSKAVENANSKADGKPETKEAPWSSMFPVTSSASSVKMSVFNSTSKFSFGNTTSSFPSGGFSFGQTSNNSTSKPPCSSTSSGFSFGISSNLSSNASTSGFGSTGGAASTSSKKDEDDEDYVPPKPEVKEIKEKDSFYTIRCKLFYKKDDQWADRGVGNLHLKAVEEKKTQIVIRADTNLGNILFNILLAESLPVSRQGKNNVLIVCTPNPPIKEGDKDPKPVPMLVRVKTEADADELLAKLEERKKLLS